MRDCPLTDPCPAYMTLLAVSERREAEIRRLRAALKPLAELADRAEYSLDDAPHELFLNAKLALRGLRIVNGIIAADTTEQTGTEPDQSPKIEPVTR